jgi:hypothetical protein
MGGRHLDGSEKNALQGRGAWIELDQGQFEEGGRVGLGKNLIVGGVERRWPLSEWVVVTVWMRVVSPRLNSSRVPLMTRD